VNSKISTEQEFYGWDIKSWLWVLLCAVGIILTVPIARSIQTFIKDTIGREFFTYSVLFTIIAASASLLYFFIYRLRVKKVSQYIWLFICAGLYIHFTIELRKYPEEAIHLIEYGLLSYFLFRALSHKIRDWTVYLSAVSIASFVGITDEFIQWITPGRYWGLKDIEINAIGSGILLLAIWKGIKPGIICKPVKKFSITLLAGIITLELILTGLCLSNTPDSVKLYTAFSDKLSWLRSEEPMTEFGYKYKDPEIGFFCSRLTLEELKEIDLNNGEAYGHIIHQNKSTKDSYQNLDRIYTPYTNPFLFEFLIHLSRRDAKFDEFKEKGDSVSKIKAYKENFILEKYFGNTLKHSNLTLPAEKMVNLESSDSLLMKNYTSSSGQIITSFNIHTAWLFIITIMVILWISAEFWKRRLSDD
jgi:VanZ family protein